MGIMKASTYKITIGKIDASNIRAVQVEKDFTLRDLATKEIIGFSALKFLKAGPLGTFYMDRPPDKEYQRLLDERRNQDLV